MARDDDVLGLGLRDASGNGADACLGDQLDRDIGLRVDAFEIVDQLGETISASSLSMASTSFRKSMSITRNSCRER